MVEYLEVYAAQNARRQEDRLKREICLQLTETSGQSAL